MTAADLFVFPEALPILAAAPLVWILLRVADRSRDRRLDALVGPRRRTLARDASPVRRGVRRALFATGLFLAMTAALRPVWGEGGTSLEQRGVDLVVCLDVSRSMLARDAGDSRLASAKREIRALAQRAGGDRLGLVAFAGEARLVSPLTSDLRSFVEIADAADPLTVQRGGTDLGAALDVALDALDAAPDGNSAVVLVTDGEDLGGRGLAAAERCRARGVVVHCVGFGSSRGSKIVAPGARGEEFVRDRSGAEVVSVLDAVGLRRIAEATGGTFVQAGGSSQTLAGLYETRVLTAARKSLTTSERRRQESRFQWPLAAALLLWILELCLTDRRPH